MDASTVAAWLSGVRPGLRACEADLLRGGEGAAGASVPCLGR